MSDTETPVEQTPEEMQSINREMLQNVPVTLSIEVGRATIKIKDLLRLTQGSVVELDRMAGEPLDLLINNTVVAQGEIVLVNDRYGIRLTRVVPANERVKPLNRDESHRAHCGLDFCSGKLRTGAGIAGCRTLGLTQNPRPAGQGLQGFRSPFANC